MENDMTRIAKPVLVETLSASDDLIPPKHQAAYARAEEEWGDIATTNAGEYAVIAAAQSGEESAKLFLLNKLLQNPGVQKVLWRFLGPNPAFQKSRIAGGDTAIYRSIVAEALELILRRWDLTTPNTKEDYFSNFFFQVLSRVKNLTTNYNKEQNRGGIAGKVLKTEKEPEVGSYEVYTDKGKNNVETKHDPFSAPEDLDAWQTFVDDSALDSGTTPTPREVLKYFLNSGSFDAKEAGRKFGKTHQTIYTKLASMKDILEKHGIDQDAFMNLLQTHGAQSLSETL